MRTVDLQLPAQPARGCRIVVGIRLPHEVAEDLVAFAGAPRWAVVSDRQVGPLYGEPLAAALRAAGAVADSLTFPAGEAAKTRATVAELQDRLIERGCGRDTWVVAVGGGVVGDVAGFAAATLYRGIAYVQVPTTLLAMVDSSVGGKTGVDTPAGKNLVGAFHQPRRVLIDPGTLRSLPAAELRSGLAEVIKYGAILDGGLFETLEGGLMEACLSGSGAELEALVARCCELKARVVCADEREGDVRQVLNFGHTVGHAVESVLGYRIRHGEAVAVGMVAEARLGRRLVGTPEEVGRRIARLCRRAGLPTRLPAGCDPEAVVEAASVDKKVRRGELRCVVPAALGRAARGPDGVAVPVPPGLLVEVLADLGGPRR